MGTERTLEEDWVANCSDEEKYDPSGMKTGEWRPRVEDIMTLYDKLEKGETFKLEWDFENRRSPSPEKSEVLETDKKDKEVEKKEEKAAPTEFDFDEDPFEEKPAPITPRRTPGSKTPRTQKRVARMDKIMNDLIRHKKIDRELNKEKQKAREKERERQKELMHQKEMQAKREPNIKKEIEEKEPEKATESGVEREKPKQKEINLPPIVEKFKCDLEEVESTDGTPHRPLPKLKIRKDAIL